MAEYFLQSLNQQLQVVSAGTNPSSQVHPLAIQVMSEIGIALTNAQPQSVQEYLAESFDYVITVCGGAKESCPMFTGSVKNRLHIGFDDPAEATGTPEEVIAVFRRVRDEIRRDFKKFYEDTLQPLL